MASNSSALIINQLQNTQKPAGDVSAWATNTANQLTAAGNQAHMGTVAFLNVIQFMTASLVSLMQDIANAALIIATGLFMWQIIVMFADYFITHEAKKLTQQMVRKLLLFVIVSAFAGHIQAIMSFVFTSFENWGVAAGSSLAGSSNLSNPLYSWGVLGNIWASTMRIINTLHAQEGFWKSIVGDIPPTITIFLILLVTTIIILYIIIQFFLVQLDIVIQASLGSIAIAFSMLTYTQDITKGYIKSLLNAGIRLFTMIIIIFFFNYSMEYVQDLLNILSATGYFTNIQNPYQLLTIVLISALSLVVLAGFLVAKAPTIVANAMNGSGTGSGMDAAGVMVAAAGTMYGAAKLFRKESEKKGGNDNESKGGNDNESKGGGESGPRRMPINPNDFIQPKNPE